MTAVVVGAIVGAAAFAPLGLPLYGATVGGMLGAIAAAGARLAGGRLPWWGAVVAVGLGLAAAFGMGGAWEKSSSSWPVLLSACAWPSCWIC